VTVVIGGQNLTMGYTPALERAFAETNPGMADIVDVGTPHVCGECQHWLPGRGRKEEGRCALFHHRMGEPGAKLCARQRACRQWRRP
jgi:hypothetical protein